MQRYSCHEIGFYSELRSVWNNFVQQIIEAFIHRTSQVKQTCQVLLHQYSGLMMFKPGRCSASIKSLDYYSEDNRATKLVSKECEEVSVIILSYRLSKPVFVARDWKNPGNCKLKDTK